MDKPTKPPLGVLLEKTRQAKGVPVARLARAAEISDTRWRQIENGYQPVGGGQFMAVEGPPTTWARMLRAAGAWIDSVEEVSPEVAAFMREMQDVDDAESQASYIQWAKENISDAEREADWARQFRSFSDSDLLAELMRRTLIREATEEGGGSGDSGSSPATKDPGSEPGEQADTRKKSDYDLAYRKGGPGKGPKGRTEQPPD